MQDTSGGRRFTVIVKPRVNAALTRLMQRSGRNQQEAIGRAVEINDLIEAKREQGVELMFRHPDGTLEAVVII